MSGGGRFDFDDGGTYCGGWEDGKAHGYGVCTGPKGQGEYSGAWAAGFEASGVYNWPSGNNYKGQWLQGKRHGLGVETKGRWVYRGEWTQGFKGRYGVRQSTSSGAKYEGTWTTGLQDGYGVETYADGDVSAVEGKGQIPLGSRQKNTPSIAVSETGSYQGQWLRGMRHGYGVRQSVPYGLASHYRPKALRASLTSLRSEAEDDHVVKDRDRKVDESRGGFVLKAKSDESPTQRRRSLFDKHGRSSLRKGILNGLKLRKQKSTGDIKDSPRRPTGSVRSTVSNISNASADSSASGVTSASMYTDSNLSFVSQDDINDVNVTETYMGEWKNDKRSGFGISERSDGLKYEGEWYNNKKYGYGVTTFKDGTKEEGKYKNNILISSGKKSKLFLIRSSKMRERVENAVTAAQRSAQIAHQKADIAITRMANARAKAESAEEAADRSLKDSELARIKAKEFAPEFVQPGTDPNWPRVPDHHLTNHHDKIQPQSSRSLTRSPYESPPARGGDSYGPPGRSKVGANSPMSALVSSTMDCVIGPSTTQVAGNLRRLEDNKGFNNHQRYPEEAEPFVDRYASPPPPPSSADYARSNHVQPVHAEEAYSRVPDPRDRADRAFAWQQQHQQPQQQQDHRRGGGYDPGGHDPRYRKPVDPYDPYSRTKRDDSGLGPEMEYPSPGDHRQPVYAVPHPRNQLHSPAGHGHGPPPMGGGYSGAHTLDRSPDSGMSDSEDFRHISRPLVRRKTLPSIMAEPVRTTPNATSPNNALSAPPGAEPPPTQSPDLYVIENGIRKRIKAEVHARPVRPGADRPNDVMPNRLKLERMVSRGAKGSLPDVSAVSDREVMPREVVAHLSQKRRAEMLAMNDEEARRKQQEIVLRLTDLKDWCKQRQLMMLVIAVNVSLATMFFNLLSQ